MISRPRARGSTEPFLPNFPNRKIQPCNTPTSSLPSDASEWRSATLISRCSSSVSTHLTLVPNGFQTFRNPYSLYSIPSFFILIRFKVRDKGDIGSDESEWKLRLDWLLSGMRNVSSEPGIFGSAVLTAVVGMQSGHLLTLGTFPTIHVTHERVDELR